MNWLLFIQYICARKGEDNPKWTSTLSRNAAQCGYIPGDIVICQVRAATKIGFGPSTNVTIEIECDSKFKTIL